MTDKHSALVTGVTGQDGAYLVELLLGKGYAVHGIARDVAAFDHGRLGNARSDAGEFRLYNCDITDEAGLRELVAAIRPDEVYNLAAQSHVPTSLAEPHRTIEINATAAVSLLKMIVDLGFQGRTRFFQASSSEVFGEASGSVLTETSPMRPRNPYAESKYQAYLASTRLRTETGLFVTNGFLFNHESPFRSPAFVTRKISLAAASHARGERAPLRLGNLDVRRDWGHARDYVAGMWRSLQRDDPGDYIFATGENHSVREFVELAFATAGRKIRWQGEGLHEAGYDADTAERLVEIDPAFFRPHEIGATLGDASKARGEINWHPQTSFEELVREMVVSDMGQTG
ncbi:MAG: GDP-mannose 4,6-dehydratase [Parvibaculum sp.]|uniref:GDP-mannose 4,6-dehydratase n=1 Tax=Parvibaculum sp. TaxID=2024848 RepID=UPI002ABC826D|nr:GDP-mannose 4,6-dehydratase [Parvibaculum sp.]MDZ4379851.1 GDP-mannose 4,6-dehydratase [Parvibaculum sp.]